MMLKRRYEDTGAQACKKRQFEKIDSSVHFRSIEILMNAQRQYRPKAVKKEVLCEICDTDLSSKSQEFVQEHQCLSCNKILCALCCFYDQNRCFDCRE